MIRQLKLPVASFIFICFIIGCGNANTTELKAVVEKTTEPIIQDVIPAVSFVLDGRAIQSSEYTCVWKLTGGQSMLTLGVVYDREPKITPPNLTFVIHNLKDISLPISRLFGNKYSDKSKQLFSLGIRLTSPKGKPTNMNELSFSDNYSGLESRLQLNLLDTSAKIISGNFEGTVKNANEKTMKITDGKFERIPLKMVYNNLY
jgi:hypothetical protein